MREIVFDTETTGLSFPAGDRLVEIGCVELVNRCETGRTFHAYYHPERDMPEEAARVHGLRIEFLARHPRFAEAVHDLVEFIGDAPLIAHKNVARVVALSGGYPLAEACEHLSVNHGMIASFSRALVEGLSRDMDDDAFNARLGQSIDAIYRASVEKH